MREQSVPISRFESFENLAKLTPVIWHRLNFVNKIELQEPELDSYGSLADLESALANTLKQISILRPKDEVLIFWLICVGGYPNLDQYRNFESRIRIYGNRDSFYWLLETVLVNEKLFDISISTRLFSESALHLVDVTHTFGYPHVTGIQRVVREISKEAANLKEVSFIRWDTFNSIVVVLDKSSLFDLKTNVVDQRKGDETLVTLFNSLYLQLGLWSEVGFFKPKIKVLIRPFSRMIRRKVLSHKKNKSYLVSNTGEQREQRNNLYILGHSLTLLDVGMDHGPNFYPYLLDNSIKFQAVLYDVIPIFHPEFFKASHLTSSFSLYLSYVLKFDRLIGISQLVAEQAQLLSRAMSIETPESNRKKIIIESLNLPSGVNSTFREIDGWEDSRPPLFIMVGTIEPRKNHKQFLEALVILHQLGIEIEALLIGISGWDNDKVFESLSEYQGLGVRVKHLPRVSDLELEKYYISATAVLSLSQAEGFGLPIVEAASFGTTVIASRIRPFVDLPVNDIHFVDVGDSVGLSELLLSLVENNTKVFTELISRDNNTTLPSWTDWSNKLFKENF